MKGARASVPAPVAGAPRAARRALLAWPLPAALAGCAASMHPDFENVYVRHDVPDALLAAIREQFARHGLAGAAIVRDRLGRVELAGRYANEAEVDRAFVIAQNVVGMRATSMVYPTDVREKAWEQETARAFERWLQRRRETARPASGAAAPPRRFALIVGLGRFADPSIPRLPGVDKDVGTLETLLRAQGGWRAAEMTVLRDAQATRDAILRQLERLVREPGPADSVFVFVASHGVQPIPDPRGREVRKYPVFAYDTRASSPVATYETALHDTELIDVVQRGRAREIVVVLDTCYSGSVFASLPQMRLAGEASERFVVAANGGEPERDGLGSRTLAQRWLPARPAAPPAAAQAPARAGDDDAAVSLLTASGPGEESGESRGILPAPSGRPFDGGVFTQSFAEGLRLYAGDVPRAFRYAQVFVSLFVRERSRGRREQTPQILVRPEGAGINLFRRA